MKQTSAIVKPRNALTIIKKVFYRDSDGTSLKFHWNLNEITLVSLHRTIGLLMRLRFS